MRKNDQVSQSYPSAPPPPEQQQSQPPVPESGWADAPRQLRPLLVLLVINLALSVALTVVTIVARHSLVNYQLDHRHITDPQQRATLENSYIGSMVGRVIGNIVVSVVYVFLVRALVRGRRWAYRRVIYVSALGIVALILIQLTPYPPWMRAEQLIQAVVLAAMLYVVTRPGVRAHFAAHLPGRNVRRFNRR
jgi:hypothetical protein